ncbi:MAG: hypothetical protein ABI830_08885 [Pseudolabrys sp.]
MSKAKSESKPATKETEAAGQATTNVKFDLDKDKLFGLTGFTTMAVTTN